MMWWLMMNDVLIEIVYGEMIRMSQLLIGVEIRSISCMTDWTVLSGVIGRQILIILEVFLFHVRISVDYVFLLLYSRVANHLSFMSRLILFQMHFLIATITLITFYTFSTPQSRRLHQAFSTNHYFAIHYIYIYSINNFSY